MEEYGPIESLDERVYRFKQYVASLNFDLKDTLRHPHIFEPKRKYFVPKLADVQYGDAVLKEVLPCDVPGRGVARLSHDLGFAPSIAQ